MSIRSNGSYIGFSRTPTTSQGSASGIWDLRTAERQQRAGAWPMPLAVPQTISGLQLWLDASDDQTLYDATSGGSLVAADGGVARWEDKSGNARHFTQSDSARRPLRKTSVQNSLDVLRFDGSSDYMVGGDYLDVDGAKSITLLAVVKRNAQDALHEIFNKYGRLESSTAGQDDKGYLLQITSDNKMRTLFSEGGVTSNLTADNATAASAFTVFAWKMTGGSLLSTTMYSNGSTVSSTLSGTMQSLSDNTYEVRIGISRFSSSFYDPLNGDIAELIAYDSALSDTDREAVENYLATKWGVTLA